MSTPDSPRASFFAPVTESVPPEEIDDLGNDWFPRWSGPPQDVRPGVVALSVVLGQSEATAVLIEGARAYAEGVVLRIVVVVNDATLAARRRVLGQLDITHGRGSLHLCLPAGGLRWGFELSDGRRVTTLDESPWNELPDDVLPADWTPAHPMMDVWGRPAVVAQSWSRDVWLWPLPPAGTLRAVCSWPDRGINETDTVIDTASLRVAAAEATRLWP